MDSGPQDAPEREDDEVEPRMEHLAPGFVGAGTLECPTAGVKGVASRGGESVRSCSGEGQPPSPSKREVF
ncbi:MAG: hypothetical protein ACJAYU_004857 [Bradymonadia bacterium]